MEAEDCASGWRAPVLHDAINAAVMNSRWSESSLPTDGGVSHPQAEADRAYLILKRMLDMGADIRGVDSHGNSCIWRLCLQARQVLPSYNHSMRTIETNRILTPELEEDLKRIFTLLYSHGMNPDDIKPGESITVRELYKAEPVSQFLVLDQTALPLQGSKLNPAHRHQRLP